MIKSLVRNHYGLINNVDKFVKQASSSSNSNGRSGGGGAGGGEEEEEEVAPGRKYQRIRENFAKSSNQNSQINNNPISSSPIVQEMDTFIAISHNNNNYNHNTNNHQHNNNNYYNNHNHNQSNLINQSNNSSKNHHNHHHHNHNHYSNNNNNNNNNHNVSIETINQQQHPIPALPPIECSNKRGRLEPLTIEEYESRFRKSGNDLELIERVFFGSISCNQLRSALWPYLFGLVNFKGKFKKNSNLNSNEYVYIENKKNIPTWANLKDLYYVYENQWKSILPEQELRFSIFRERKSLIERDVIRCDRLHPFYAEVPENLETLTNLLLTYTMYDFDIGYVQGMSDLAGPILYMNNGDLIKSFWIFVEVMKLFRRNFESTQKTIHFQLNCLYELIKNTDPIFASYLHERDSSNCYFTFRAIVCQFKRELMKDGEDDYSKVLSLWDTIWSVKRRSTLLEEFNLINKLEEKNNFNLKLNNNNNNNNNYFKNGKNYHEEEEDEVEEEEQEDNDEEEEEKKLESILLSASNSISASLNGRTNGFSTNGHNNHHYQHHRHYNHNHHNHNHNHNHYHHHNNNNNNNNNINNNNYSYHNNNHHQRQIRRRNSINCCLSSSLHFKNNINNDQFVYNTFDQNQSDTPRHSLTETEIFILALCMSMIRRERDLIMTNRLEGPDIHLHFINPKLASDLKGFIEHAINIYSYLKNDFDIEKMTSPKENQQKNFIKSAPKTIKSSTNDTYPESPFGSADGYDLLSDFLIINAASGS